MVVKQVIQTAVAHLRNADPIMSSIIEDQREYRVYRRQSAFESLIRIVIGQQLSTHAARTIFNRFKAKTVENRINHRTLSELDDDSILAAGVSGAKLRTIRTISEEIESDNLNLRRLSLLNDNEVSEKLTSIKGIGPWTAQIYLMFVLHRLDVFPESDRGIINAIEMLYRLKKDSRKYRSTINLWKPYRTIACWHLWQFIDNNGK